MKKLTLALLGAFAINIPTYAQSDVLGTIVETVKVIETISDILDGGSNYNDYGYDYPPPPPRPSYGPPPPRGGYGYGPPGPHRSYPGIPHGSMGHPRPGMGGPYDHGSMIGRPDKPHGSMGGHHDGPDGREDMMGKPDARGPYSRERMGEASREGRESGGFERHHEGNPMGHDSGQRGGIFGGGHHDSGGHFAGMSSRGHRGGSHGAMFGGNHGHHGGFSGGGHHGNGHRGGRHR